MSEFPLLFTVGHQVFDASSEDAHGNPVEGWLPAVERRVYGWGAPQSSEPKLAGHDREIVEVELLVPPGFVVAARDRIVLDGVEFDVIGGAEHFDHNPFGWNPGGVINLKAVSG